jgi:hypothetical protein
MVTIVEEVLPGPNAERTAKDLRTHYPGAFPYLYQSAIKTGAGIAEGIVNAFGDSISALPHCCWLFPLIYWQTSSLQS